MTERLSQAQRRMLDDVRTTADPFRRTKSPATLKSLASRGFINQDQEGVWSISVEGVTALEES